MNKKIMVLALAAVSAVVLALPAMASALTPLHLEPTPTGVKTIDGEGVGVLTTSSLKIECQSFHGEATFTSGAGGNINLTFGPTCSGPFGIHCQSEGQATGVIKTTTLPFDLATVGAEEPGVIVTPNNGHFASFNCGLAVSVTGNGVIGTLSNECGETSSESTIDFNAVSAGNQEDKKLTGTSTEYNLKNGSSNAAQDSAGKLTLNEEVFLNCT